jgi:low temperature requirement protein LtrA
MRTDNHRAGFVELCFDLVFVFAVTQISHHFLARFDAGGATQTALVFLAVWRVWIYPTWALNRLDPDSTPVRPMLFLMTGAGLFLSMAIPEPSAGVDWSSPWPMWRCRSGARPSWSG